MSYEPKTDAGHTLADWQRFPECCPRHHDWNGVDATADRYQAGFILRRRQQLDMFLDEIRLLDILETYLLDRIKDVREHREKAGDFVVGIMREAELANPPYTPQMWRTLMEPRESEIARAVSRANRKS